MARYLPALAPNEPDTKVQSTERSSPAKVSEEFDEGLHAEAVPDPASVPSHSRWSSLFHSRKAAELHYHQPRLTDGKICP